MSILSGLANPATGRIRLVTGVQPVYYHRGLGIAADGIALIYGGSAFTRFIGVWVDATGRMLTTTYIAATLPITYVAGLPIDANGRLLFAAAAAQPVAYQSQGITFAADNGINYDV